MNCICGGAPELCSETGEDIDDCDCGNCDPICIPCYEA